MCLGKIDENAVQLLFLKRAHFTTAELFEMVLPIMGIPNPARKFPGYQRPA